MADEMCVLMDGRGCSVVLPLHSLDWDGEAFRIPGHTWHRLRFVQTARDKERRRVLRTSEPAIGPKDRPYDPLYLPAGWEAPHRG